jgi:hypothetical protein
MKVARQVTAWDAQKGRPVPAGRFDLLGITASLGLKKRTGIGKPHRPSGTERVFQHIPGSELPGYLHFVPPGLIL